MSRITRESFIDTMSSGSPTGLDPSSLAEGTLAALDGAGITPQSLGEIAGADQRIKSRDELSRLFDLIDRVDRNGSRNSIAVSTRTLSGAAAQALQDEIENARVNRGAQGPITRQPHAAHERAIATFEAVGFTDIHLAPNTPYYNQGEEQFANVSYPKSPPVSGATRTLGEAGCAPMALAMADATLRGTKTTPIETARFAVDHALSGSPTGFGTETKRLAKEWAATHDLKYTAADSGSKSERADAIMEGLRSGGVALVSVGIDRSRGQGHFTNTSHVMLVNGYAKDADGQEWFFVANPGRRDQTDSKGLTIDETVKQDLSLSPAAGRVRISRAQFEAELNYACILERRV
jgi:hypothetical protein